MNTPEYLLGSLGEECNEIAQLTSKSNRFGLRDVYEGSDNLEKLIGEINDFFGVIKELQARGILPKKLKRAALIAKKRKKILHYMRYARQVGTLKD